MWFSRLNSLKFIKFKVIISIQKCLTFILIWYRWFWFWFHSNAFANIEMRSMLWKHQQKRLIFSYLKLIVRFAFKRNTALWRVQWFNGSRVPSILKLLFKFSCPTFGVIDEIDFCHFIMIFQKFHNGIWLQIYNSVCIRVSFLCQFHKIGQILSELTKF